MQCKGGLKYNFAKKDGTLTSYALALRDFADFIKSGGPFSDTLAMDLYLFPHEWWDLIKVNGHTLHPSLITLWHKCVPLWQQNWS